VFLLPLRAPFVPLSFPNDEDGGMLLFSFPASKTEASVFFFFSPFSPFHASAGTTAVVTYGCFLNTPPPLFSFPPSLVTQNLGNHHVAPVAFGVLPSLLKSGEGVKAFSFSRVFLCIGN